MGIDFIVSARKYRPQTFLSVVGQRHITDTLRSAISGSQVAHAYLFTGPRGVGKTTCARIFARSINCLSPSVDFEPCGVCESCVSFASDRSFNIHEIDAASNNSVDDIRLLTDKVRVAPQVGRYSVYIIDEVHMLSSAAFNAFLKTLEEPPPHAIFILATTERHKILPTIVSRCQVYDFRRIGIEDIVGYLRHICGCEGISSDDDSLHLIARGADGGMRDALSTFDRVVSFCGTSLVYSDVSQCLGSLDYDTYFTVVDLALAGSYGDLLVLFDGILSRGFDGQHFLGGLAGHFRSLLVVRGGGSLALLDCGGSLRERYCGQAERCGVDFLFTSLGLVSGADASYRLSTSRRLHVEFVLMRLCGLTVGVTSGVALPRVASSVPAQQPQQPQQPLAVSETVPTPQPQQPQAVLETVPTPQPQQPQAVSEPVQQPQPQAVLEPVQAIAKQPVAAVAGSILGISISGLAQGAAPGGASVAPRVLSDDEGFAALSSRWGELVSLWEGRGKSRIAAVLATATVERVRILVTVPNDIMELEVSNSMLDIEGDMVALFGYRLPVEVIVVEVVGISSPVTIEQRVQFLADKNPNVLKLKDALDLTL